MGKKKQPEPLDHEISESLVIDYANGYIVVRDNLAKNEYNKDGITLATIDMEIAAAYEYGDAEQLYIHLARGFADSITRQEAQQTWDRGWNLFQSGGTGRPKEIRSAHPIEPIVAQRSSAPPLPTQLLQAGDKERAKLLCDCPIALIRSLEHQDAVCRWLFASRCLPHGEDRDRAEEFLKDSKAVSRRRKKLGEFNRPQMKQAYQDLKTYTEGWFDCIREERDSDAVYRMFPDCKKMKPVVTTIDVVDAEEPGQCTMSFDQVMDPGYIKPKAHKIAYEYIRSALGITIAMSTFFELIDVKSEK